METYTKQKNHYQLSLFLFSSNVDPKNNNKHSRKTFCISVWANSCNKLFKSIFINREITCDTVIKRHLRSPLPPFWEIRGSLPPSCPPLGRSRCDTSRQSAQLWNSQSPECRTTSPNREIPALLVQPSVQNAPGKIGEASLAGYTQGKAAQTSSKGHVEWLHLQPSLVPSWCGANRIIWNCCWPWGISSPPRLRPSWVTTLPGGKAGRKMNEKMNIRGSIHDNAQIKSSSTFKSASTFRFQGNKSHLFAWKCLQ